LPPLGQLAGRRQANTSPGRTSSMFAMFCQPRLGRSVGAYSITRTYEEATGRSRPSLASAVGATRSSIQFIIPEQSKW
jgi:hypothetical protein